MTRALGGGMLVVCKSEPWQTKMVRGTVGGKNNRG
jgi:hypothetical protein